MSTYQPNIPTGLVNLDVDYQNIKNNFSQLDTTYGVNHIKYSVTANNGKHTFVEMVNSGSIPAGLAASEGTVYTKLVSGQSQMFYTPDNTGNEYQMTRTITASFGSLGAATGWTFLPGGMMLQYSQTVINTGGNTVINFPVAFTTGCYSVVITPIRNGSNVDIVYLVSKGLSSFTVRNTSNSDITECTWMAIGV